MSGSRIDHHLAEAARAQQSGLVDEARAHFEAVIALDETEPNARNWLGAEALSRSDGVAAASHFALACAGDPDEISHWINLAAARRLLGDSAGEREALEGALAIDQTNLLALIRIAELHERLGELTPAAERWNAVRAIGGGIADPSPEFRAILLHAAEFVSEQQEKLADAVDQALAHELSAASTRDRRRMKRAADCWLGRNRVFTNHCEGLHFPFLPADEFFDRDLFPWLTELEAATAAIRSELKALLSDTGVHLEPYIDLPPGVPPNQWSELDKSLDWGAFHLWKEGRRFDEACARAPATAALIEALPMCHIEGRAPNAFFSILKAGAHIPPHTGVTNVRSVVHLPLIVPPGCGFRVGGEVREWVEGQAFAFDDTIEHEAWNRSGRDRAVLIIDAWNPHMSERERTMVCSLYAAADTARSDAADR